MQKKLIVFETTCSNFPPISSLFRPSIEPQATVGFNPYFMINIQRRPSPYPHPSGRPLANFQPILNSTTPHEGGTDSNYCPRIQGVTHMGQFGTMGLTLDDTSD